MPETEEQRKARLMREADQAARSMFGGALFAPNFLQRAGAALTSARIPSERELLPASQFATPTIPQFGPLIRTSRFRSPESQRMAEPAPQLAASTVPAFPMEITTPPSATDMTLRQQTSAAITQQPIRRTTLPFGLVESQRTATPSAPNVPIQTPYGTVYASNQRPEGGGLPQSMRANVAEIAGRPAQAARLENIGAQARQGAAIAQMRERGATMAQNALGAQEAFFAQKRAERGALRVAENAARAAGVNPMDVMRAREAAAGPTTIGGIQRQFASYQPPVGPMAPTNLYANMASSQFNAALPAGGSRQFPTTSLGPSGYALYEQQQAARVVRDKQIRDRALAMRAQRESAKQI